MRFYSFFNLSNPNSRKRGLTGAEIILIVIIKILYIKPIFIT